MSAPLRALARAGARPIAPVARPKSSRPWVARNNRKTSRMNNWNIPRTSGAQLSMPLKFGGGANGSGKSALLQNLASFENGQSADSMDYRSQTAMAQLGKHYPHSA